MRWIFNRILKFASGANPETRQEVGEDGTKKWYRGDKLHREGKPAVEYANAPRLGTRTASWIARTALP